VTLDSITALIRPFHLDTAGASAIDVRLGDRANRTT